MNIRYLFKITALTVGLMAFPLQQVLALTVTADPEAYLHNNVINTEFYGVTLSTTLPGGVVYAKDVTQDIFSEWGFASTGIMVFGRDGNHGGYIWDMGWLDDPFDDHRFIAVFDTPVNMVSLDGIASDPIDEWTLEAYNSADVLIASAMSTLVGGPGLVGTLTVTSASYDIAYIMAYGSGVSEGCPSGGPGWSNGTDLDNLIFNLPPNIFMDIKPGSCPNPLNVGNNGVLPVAILGTDEFDVTMVDPASLLLAGVAPLRWAMEDAATPYEGVFEGCGDCSQLAGDGYLDLTLKFKAQEVVAALGEVRDGDCLKLVLTGNLKAEFGGTPIEGEDFVLILKK